MEQFNRCCDFLPKRKWTALAILIVALSFRSVGLADDFKTVNGEEFRDATLKRVEPDGIVLETPIGISKIYFSELSADMQKRFRWELANTLAAPPATGMDTLRPAARSSPASMMPVNPQPISAEQRAATTPSVPEHTYEITRDYVIGGDTGNVAARLKRGERYRGRILANDVQLNIGGTWCIVAENILSAPKD